MGCIKLGEVWNGFDKDCVAHLYLGEKVST